ncbi:ring-cleaving dioxygenase [Paenibacillus sp. J31TS4]|uniref:VOC family protein n=1 Tax=Paenibacillus sp. J31TS4 TaxID=2807195 RepID=UPI001B0EDF34|nr:VOC family protein [Paenibacillus sp. J31TS4]GIP40793.1 ring-cleaving dioxygenase [Paenibacillus sp. J31TS4]
MLTYTGIHHVSLNVRELEPARAFYREVLGLQEIARPPFDFAGAWFAVGDTGQQLHLIVYDGETLREGGADSQDGHFALRVANYREALKHLERLGVVHEARPHARAGFPQIYLTDPDRNVIELNAERLDSE